MSTMSTFKVVSDKFYAISLAAWPQEDLRTTELRNVVNT
jgi:hypothetical protein